MLESFICKVTGPLRFGGLELCYLTVTLRDDNSAHLEGGWMGSWGPIRVPLALGPDSSRGAPTAGRICKVQAAGGKLGSWQPGALRGEPRECGMRCMRICWAARARSGCWAIPAPAAHVSALLSGRLGSHFPIPFPSPRSPHYPTSPNPFPSFDRCIHKKVSLLQIEVTPSCLASGLY